MPAVATDNFDRANGGLGSNWTDTVDEGYSPTISSNQVTSSGNGDSAAFWNADTFNNDQYSKIVIKALGTAHQFNGALVRANASDWVIGQQIGANNVAINWYNGGAYTSIASASYTTAVNDVFELRVAGSLFSLYINGSLICSGSNGSAPSSGRPGIVASWDGIIDDWEGGNGAFGDGANYSSPFPSFRQA